MFNRYKGDMYSQGGLSDIDMYDNPYLGGEENMPAYAKGGAVKVAKKKPDIRSMAEKNQAKG